VNATKTGMFEVEGPVLFVVTVEVPGGAVVASASASSLLRRRADDPRYDRGVGRLDDYDPGIKWHHFAFRADAGRARELHAALEPWITRRDRAPLERYWATYMPGWLREYYGATVRIDPSIFAPLIEHAAIAGVDPAQVRARAAALGIEMKRCLHEGVVAFPSRVERLAQLRTIIAPPAIVQHELEVIRDTLSLAVTPSATDNVGMTDAAKLDFSDLFEDAVDLAVGDPWATNVSFGRMFGIADGQVDLPPSTYYLVDVDWPVHPDHSEYERCAYGLSGFGIGVVEKAEKLDHADAFRTSRRSIRAYALECLADALEAENVKLSTEDDGDRDDGDDLNDDGNRDDDREQGDTDRDDDDRDEAGNRCDEADDRDPDENRYRRVEELAPERARAAIEALHVEWRECASRLDAALRDVAAGRCVLLQWDGKNISL